MLYASRTYATSMTSVRLSVSNVGGCDHSAKKVALGKWQDRWDGENAGFFTRRQQSLHQTARMSHYLNICWACCYYCSRNMSDLTM